MGDAALVSQKHSPQTTPAAGVGAALPILNQQTEPPRRTHYCVQSAITANSMFKPSPAYSLHTAINPNQQPGLFSKSLPGRTQWKSWLNPPSPWQKGEDWCSGSPAAEFCLVFQNTLPLWLSSPPPYILSLAFSHPHPISSFLRLTVFLVLSHTDFFLCPLFFQ